MLPIRLAACLLLIAANAQATDVSVGNFVWFDKDKDGLQDAGEPGLAGVTVQLWNADKTSLLGTTTTNANGNYVLTAPGAGTYRIRVLLPSSLDSFSPIDATGADTTDSDVVGSGPDFGFTNVYTFPSNLIAITTIDAGIVRVRNIGDRVWSDADEDGIQDPGEPGVSGVRVELYDASRTTLLATATTSATGAYSLAAPGPDDYYVKVLPARGKISPKNAGSSNALDNDFNPSGALLGYTDLTTVTDNDTSIDAGVIPDPISVGNFVWEDLNRNGEQDAGEPGLPGVTVQLWNDAISAALDSTVTNASGIYTLLAPGAGSYRVRVLLPDGATFSPKDDAATDLVDSDVYPNGATIGFTDPYTLSSNVISISSIDAGIARDTLFGNGFE